MSAQLDSPLVSVCVATYNQDRYIQDCLVSVLQQLPDASMEILIGDDGTSPDTPGIVENLMQQYPGVIRYYRHASNLGPSGNYQFLARAARGQYLAHLDGDDFWLPGKIRAQLQWFKDNPQGVACYTNAVMVSDEREVRGVFSSEVPSPVSLEYLLEQGNFLNHSSMLYRAEHKDVIVGVVGSFIDYRMHLNFARLAPLGFIPAAYVVYRLGSEHSMIRTTPGLVQDLYFEAIASVLPDPAVSARARKRALTHFWRAIALQAMVRGRVRWAMSWARKIRTPYPGEARAVLPLGVLLALLDLQALLVSRGLGRMLRPQNLSVLHKR